MKIKILYITLIILLSSCAKRLPAENTLQADSGGQTEQEPEWLIIGGQKVDSFEQSRKYEYYLKSEKENIDFVRLYIDPKNENRAASLVGIEQLVNLQVLRIVVWNWDIFDYSPLNAIRNLQSITFESREKDKPTRIPDLSGLAAREKIIGMAFINCALTNMDNIEFLPNLRVVRVERNYGNITDLKPLNKLRHLETLKIFADEEGSIFRIEEIASLSNLKLLWLCGWQIDAKGIEQLKNLEEILFFDSNVINTGYLSELKNVRRLEMVIRDPEPDITFLKGMESLERLSITREADIWYYNAQYQVLDLTPLGSLSQLSSLEIRGYILRNVAYLDKLDNLDYEGTHLYGSVLYDSSEKSKKLNFYHGDH